MVNNDLIKRSYAFAVSVGQLILMLRNSVVNKAYSTQLVRSSSSVYANYRAAQREKSSADFLYKLKIVEQECDESIGFLELLRVFNPSQREKIEAIANEAEELLKIFVASIKTVKNKIDLNKKSKQQ